MIRKPRNSHRNTSAKLARRSLHQRRRHLKHEQLESRELLALLSSGSGDGHLQVSVNEYGAFGRSGDLDVTNVLNPNGPREVNDAFYDPVGTTLGRAGTTFESAIAIKVGGDPTTFLTAGTIANSGNFNNGAFQTPVDPNQRTLRSTFYYPNTVPANGAGATLRIDLFQQVVPRFVSGTTPVGVTLQQQYTVTNLTGSPVDVQIFRYFDGDQLFDGSFTNDGAGMRQVIQNNPELTWMTNTALNTNLNDPSFIEVRSATTGIVRPNRWEVGLATGILTTAPNPLYTPANPGKNQPTQANGPLVQKILNGGPLSDDIVGFGQADIDGNNAVDNNRGADWATALRNAYTIPGGGNTVYLTETQFGDPQIGDVPPPIVLPPQQGVVAGQKFSDRNGNGIIDGGETGVAGFRIYADTNNDSQFTPGEPSTVTGAGGFYQLALNVGTYTIREVNQANWTQTAPATGFYTVTIVNAGDLFQNRNFGNQAAPAQVSGIVFDDFNKNGRLDAGEGGVAGAVIYADLNNNNIPELNEPSATSGAGGVYTISNLDPASYVIRQVPPAGYDQTFPSNNGAQLISLQPGQILSGINFGDALKNGSVDGRVFLDLNNNGTIDPGEPGAANVIVYIDRDNNCNIGLGENAIYTGPSGTFGMLGIRPGTYTIRMAPPAGVEQILPAGGSDNCGAGYTITVLPGASTGPILFLVGSTGGPGTKDFGDAPFPYPTTLAQNGARASVANNFGLGSLQDTELDGQPSPLADNDDFITSPDEDGVQFVDGTNLARNKTYNIAVTVETGNRSAGRLQAFFDWNRDGDWNDAGEKVISDRVLPAGTHIIPVSVPSNAVFGKTFARFRYGYELGLGPTGDSILGEVEDYDLFIVGPNPDAINDTFSFGASAVPPYILDVLANDIPSESGGSLITNVSSPNASISPDQLTIEYTPTGNTAVETFTYTITDAAGNTDTATVTVNILLPPNAVDDAYVFQGPAIAAELNVTLNDQPGIGPVTITSFTAPSQGGQVVLGPNGTTLIYTAPVQVPAFAGTETFSYTVTNAAGLTSTAEVTVTSNQVLDTNNLVRFKLTLVKLDGVTPLDDLVIAPTQMFKVLLEVEDLRPFPPSLDPNATPPDLQGVAAAYMDLLFDPTLLEVVTVDPATMQYPLGFEIDFDGPYNAGRTGQESTPGIIDEVGAFQGEGGVPLGEGLVRVFTVTLRAKENTQGPAFIVTDPADVSPDSDVLLFNRLQPAVGVDEIEYDQVIVTIDPNETLDNTPGVGPLGEGTAKTGTGKTGVNGEVSATGKWHNFNNRADINGDGLVAPLDALLIINALNASGSRALTGTPLPLALANPVWLDVNGDDVLSPLDALLVINQLNSRGSSGAQGEAMTSSAIVSAATPAALQAEPMSTASAQAETITLAPGESATLPLFDSSSSTGSAVDEDSSDTGLDLSFAAAVSLPEETVWGNAASTDFGRSFGTSEDEDKDFDLLVGDLAQDTCSEPRL